MAFYERRSSLKIIRHWRGRRARLRKAQADELRRERAAAKEKARQEAVLHVSVEDDHPSDSAAVSPVPNKRAQEVGDEGVEESEDEEELEDEEEEVEDEEQSASPSDARVGANLR